MSYLDLTDEQQSNYASWLMANAELHICNGDDLIRHIEQETRLDEFLVYDEDAQMARDSVKF